jgi:CubicO group peptidase (beta-lactamase class C family)
MVGMRPAFANGFPGIVRPNRLNGGEFAFGSFLITSVGLPRMNIPTPSRLGVLAAALLAFNTVTAADTAAPATSLPRATPESQGISSAGIQALIDDVEARKLGLHGIMILRHGKVVAEGWWAPYAATEPHMLFSLSKSFTSTAIGLLQAEGRINIHDKLLQYFPEDTPAETTENQRNLRIRDLLMMSTGQHKEDVDKINVMAADKSGTKQFLAAAVKQKPGTLFYYNSPATFMLSATVQKVTGQTVRDYLTSRLFEPLGIPTPDWDLTPQGYNFGASGLHLRTEDIAKFGQLLLQRGEWQGKRLVPADWIDLATSRQVSNGSNPDSDWDQGYGFQFWRCVPGFYRADGAMGQFCIVMPQHDTVVAINSGAKDMGAVMKTVWTKLLPELRAAAIPENSEALLSLRNRLSALSMPLTTGAATSPLAAKVSGRKFTFEKHDSTLESASLEVGADGTVTLKARVFGKDESVTAGQGKWLKGTFPLTRDSTQPVAVSGAWTADDTYTVQLAQYRSPFIATIRLKFTGDELTVEREMNVGFGPTKPTSVTGKAL